VHSTNTDAALLVGLDPADDAAVYELAPGLALVQTVDFFTPIVDDPRDWGRIAAANALSDVYAMGGRPITALNLVAWPRALDFDLLGQVLEGAMAQCEEAGVAVVGGHSVDDPEPKFGLAVTGLVDPGSIVRKAGAGPGCALFLTKPLGTGIVSTALKQDIATTEQVARATEVMTTLNRAAAEAMVEVKVAAATDVTGFGLLGHLHGMLAPGTAARVVAGNVPLLPGALELAAQGVLPGGSRRNRASLSDRVSAAGVDDALLDVLFDAQTSGGLLIAIESARADELRAALAARAVEAAEIGHLVEGEQTIEVVP
jgi:selenide,water dikinase